MDPHTHVVVQVDLSHPQFLRLSQIENLEDLNKYFHQNAELAGVFCNRAEFVSLMGNFEFQDVQLPVVIDKNEEGKVGNALEQGVLTVWPLFGLPPSYTPKYRGQLLGPRL